MHFIQKKPANQFYHIYTSDNLKEVKHYFNISTLTSIVDLQHICDSFHLGTIISMFVSYKTNIIQFAIKWNIHSDIYKLLSSNNFNPINIPDTNIFIY